MNKKINMLILTAMITLSITGCASSKEVKVPENKVKSIEENIELTGSWSADYTREEVEELYQEGLARVEQKVLFYGLEDIYTIVENEISTENNVSVNSSYIYLDIEEPESNRLESMYYGFKQFNSDLSIGQLTMKLSMNLDKEAYIENGVFNFEESSFAAFSEAFTGVSQRDYTKLNEQIFDIFTGKSNKSTIENNLDGIKETITIIDDFIIYKLDTREYEFNK